MRARTGALLPRVSQNIFLVSCIAFTLVCGGRAAAIAEFCPAEIQPPHALEPTTGRSALYAYSLHAEGPRSVAGSIMFDTSMGWFTAGFTATSLTARTYNMEDEYVAFTRTTFESDALYVRFPQPVTLKAAYVSSATTSGDRLFGWDAKGTVECPPRAGFEALSTATPRPRGLKTLNPRTDLDATPPPTASIAVAALTSAPGSTDCEVPFANASVVSTASLEYPPIEAQQRVSGAVWVEVAVNGDGSLADAWIFAPSGSRDFDAAALRSAKLSKYRGGRVFCRPAGGDYLFYAVFHP
jgi:TonB family protein